MIYAVLFEDDPQRTDRRATHMAQHLAFLARHSDKILAAGPVKAAVEEKVGAGLSDEGVRADGLWLVRAEGPGEVAALTREDPFWSTGLRRSIRILAWHQVFAEGQALI